jgi:hypothetical protein
LSGLRENCEYAYPFALDFICVDKIVVAPDASLTSIMSLSVCLVVISCTTYLSLNLAWNGVGIGQTDRSCV